MKHKSRIKTTAEIFTPPELVNEMLDKIPDEQYVDTKTFCDPACGDGAFLIELKKKLVSRNIPAQHVTFNQLYGAELMTDNAMDCIFKMLTSGKVDLDDVEIDRIGKRNQTLPRAIAVEDNDKLIVSRYRFNDMSICIARATQQSVRVSPKYVGVKRKLITQELKRGVKWFNFKINDGEWWTFPNIVSCNSLEYDFTFGRDPDFRLDDS